jgi:hypothetical protein
MLYSTLSLNQTFVRFLVSWCHKKQSKGSNFTGFRLQSPKTRNLNCTNWRCKRSDIFHWRSNSSCIIEGIGRGFVKRASLKGPGQRGEECILLLLLSFSWLIWPSRKIFDFQKKKHLTSHHILTFQKKKEQTYFLVQHRRFISLLQQYLVNNEWPPMQNLAW